MIAKDVLKLLESQPQVAPDAEPEKPCLKSMQCELLGFIKDSLTKVKMGKQGLDMFHTKEGVGAMLTPEAERLHKDIEQLIKDMFWREQ